MAFLNRFYPHLQPQDIPVWQRYLKAHSQKYSRIEYDVRVGQGRPAPPYLPSNIQQMALDLSMRRIDAIGFTPIDITIIEVTRRAGLKAIGQLTAYPVLYRQTFHPDVPVRTLLVAEKLHADIEPALIAAGIPWVLLPAQ